MQQLAPVAKNMRAAGGQQYSFTSNSGAHRGWNDDEPADDRNALTVGDEPTAYEGFFDGGMCIVKEKYAVTFLTLDGDER